MYERGDQPRKQHQECPALRGLSQGEVKKVCGCWPQPCTGNHLDNPGQSTLIHTGREKKCEHAQKRHQGLEDEDSLLLFWQHLSYLRNI
jgi:hypothetical protein